MLLMTFFSLLTPFIQGETIDNTLNPLAHVSSKPGFCSIFHSWGFIGDSLASGEHESRDKNGKKGYHDFYDYSWGQRMCAAMGVKGDNYSQGGETAKGWISHFWDQPSNRNHNIDAKASPKQAYIIALGVNDQNQKVAVGDPEKDICKDDFNKNADTYSGNYGGIIQRVRSISPDSKIFLVTNPGRKEDKATENYNQAIRKMATLFDGIYIIDLAKYAAPLYKEGTEFRKKFFLGGHMNAMGYEYTAWMFMTYINWIIEQQPEDFQQVGFIGTPYKY